MKYTVATRPLILRPVVGPNRERLAVTAAPEKKLSLPGAFLVGTLAYFFASGNRPQVNPADNNGTISPTPTARPVQIPGYLPLAATGGDPTSEPIIPPPPPPGLSGGTPPTPLPSTAPANKPKSLFKTAAIAGSLL